MKPTKPVYGANAVVPSSKLSAAADLADYAADPPACIAARVAVQSIPTGVVTAVQLDTEIADRYAMFSATSATITVSDAGIYLVTPGAYWAVNGTGDRICAAYINGAELTTGGDGAPASASNTIRQSGAQLALLAVGDTVELRVFQSSGGNLNVQGRLSIVRVSGS